MSKPLANNMPNKIKKLYNDMKVEEIDKMLSKKDISPELKKALEQRKKILVNDKVVTK
jgi:hypothetical protein